MPRYTVRPSPVIQAGDTPEIIDLRQGASSPSTCLPFSKLIGVKRITTFCPAFYLDRKPEQIIKIDWRNHQELSHTVLAPIRSQAVRTSRYIYESLAIADDIVNDLMTQTGFDHIHMARPSICPIKYFKEPFRPSQVLGSFPVVKGDQCLASIYPPR